MFLFFGCLFPCHVEMRWSVWKGKRLLEWVSYVQSYPNFMSRLFRTMSESEHFSNMLRGLRQHTVKQSGKWSSTELSSLFTGNSDILIKMMVLSNKLRTDLKSCESSIYLYPSCCCRKGKNVRNLLSVYYKSSGGGKRETERQERMMKCLELYLFPTVRGSGN